MLDYAKRFVPKRFSMPAPAAAPTDTGAAPAAEAAEAAKSPVLSPQDEKFLESAIEGAPHAAEAEEVNVIFAGPQDDAGTPLVEEAPPPPAEDDGAEVTAVGEEKKAPEAKAKKGGEWKEAIGSRLDGLRRSVSKARSKSRSKSADKSKGKGKGKEKEEVTVIGESSGVEVKDDENMKNRKEKTKEKAEPEREEDEFTAVLEKMNLAAEEGKAFTISAQTRALLATFTQILKDLTNGVPTACNDLTSFLEKSSSQLEETFSNLPGFLQKLVKTLPSKLKLSPELLRAAAAAPAAATAEGIALKDIIAKPGMIMGLLKTVVNVLKTRFPMLVGANVLLSMALFVVLLVLWYCYRRGKEERLAAEGAAEGDATIAGTGAEGAGQGVILGNEGEGGVREDPLVVKGKKVA